MDTLTSPEMDLLRLNKQSGFKYRERRQGQWKENYTLYRDTVQINRLTQRQSVNLPLMKQTIRTLLKDVDDMPVLYFENLDNDKEAEVFQNEYWKYTLDYNKMELKDIVDKRQVFLFGRSFDQMQISDGKVKFTVQDPEDILVDRYCDPTDIDSSRFLIHTHIFKPLATLEGNPMYDQNKVAELKNYHITAQGLIKAADNQQMLVKKNEKMRDMGLEDVDSPVLGETYIELSMHFCYRKEKGDEQEQLYMYIEADDMFILKKEKLENVIGVTKDNYWQTHFPYNTWADDLDRQDFWTDGVADIVRTPNKVLNSWVSQMVENRTLRNFGMNYYNSDIEGFAPQTYEPRPFGWYGIPGGADGDIRKVVQKIDIPDLSESLDEMTFVVGMIEKATGATATQQGVQTDRQVTLGEVKLALGEAKERIKGMSKFYTQAWKERGTKFLKLIEASHDKLDMVTIYKKGRNSNNMYTREITPKDWMTKTGYTTRVWSQEEKASKDTADLEKINAAKTNMPDNPKVDEVFKRKLLEFAGMTPDEVNEAMIFEQEKREAVMAAMQNPQIGPDGRPVLTPPAVDMTKPSERPIGMGVAVQTTVPKKAKPKSKGNKDVVMKLKNLKSKIRTS